MDCPASLYLMALAKEQIKLAFEQSEKEVADLHQRTREGLLTARLNGKQVGRKKGVGFETKKAKDSMVIITVLGHQHKCTRQPFLTRTWISVH